MATNINQQVLVEEEIDDRNPMDSMPYWARATNPIVRLHLGLYWRTLPPQIMPILQITAIWIIIFVVASPFPFMMDMATTIIVVSILVIPLTVVFYVRAMFVVAADSAAVMSDEIRNKTMPLLMATPMSLEQIFLGKVAAAIWRRMDDLTLITQSAAIFGPPLIIMHFAGLFPMQDWGLMSYALIIGMTIISLVRLVVEPLMFGIIAVTIGAFIPYRSTAITSSVVIVAFYYLLIFMLHQLNIAEVQLAIEAVQVASPANLSVANANLAWNILVLVMIDFVLPIALPLLIIKGLMRYTANSIQAD